MRHRSPWGSSVVSFPVSPWDYVKKPQTEAEARADHERYKRETVGRRVVFLEPEHVANVFPGWHPKQGEQGTVIDVPPFRHIGAGPTVKWDSGKTWTLGSGHRWAFVGTTPSGPPYVFG